MFLGYGAGGRNTIGSRNAYIGGYAGYYGTGATNNTFIGYGAGYHNETGDRNVCIGYNAGYNSTGSDRLYIDNSSTGTPLIYGRFDSDYVTINGKLGVGKNPVTHWIEVTGGAWCDGLVWHDVSSREYKENIESLDAEEAMETLQGLHPVRFNYKRDKED